ncbi:MAG: TIGR01212 family radical SAM protein [Thermoguttaceae bacterium]
MTSTSIHHEEPDWRASGLRYYSLNWFFRQRFGRRVWKVSVDAGLGCPNTDGTVGSGGCVFCNIRSFSPSRRLGLTSITGQLDEGIRRLKQRYGVDRFVAYFQPATNTYAPLAKLRGWYEEALNHPEILGLAVGTRPDCVPDEVLDLLADLSRRTWVSVEYGLQTIHDRSLLWMNRGHDYQAFLDAAGRSAARGLEFGAHVILGLPGETREDMTATAKEVARLGVRSVKLHNLYAVRNTPLADAVLRGEVSLPGREEYIGYVANFLEVLPSDCVVERLCGDAPAEYLVAPAWCRDKTSIRAAVEAELARRGSWQGKGS